MNQLPNCCFRQFPTNTNQSWFQWIKLLFQDWSSEQTWFSVLWHNTHGSWWAPDKPSNCTLALSKPAEFLIWLRTLLYYLPIWWIVMLGSISWVRLTAVKVQVSSIPTVSRHAFAMFAFEPVTSTKQTSSPNTALNATAEMQPSADILENLGTQLIVQLIDAYISNKDEICSVSQLAAKLLHHKSSCASRLAARAQCLKSPRQAASSNW